MDIIQRIEKLRWELVEQGQKKGLQDPNVIELSQRLDKLINAYYKYESKKLNIRATG